MKKLILAIGAFFMLVNFVSGQTYTTPQTHIFGNKTTIGN